MSSMIAVRPRTLSDALLPRDASRPWLFDAGLIVLFSVFVALTAQIRFVLPFTPVPITGQTLGVLLTGAVLGRRRGALALALYLAEGAMGLPVFAPGGAPGIARFFGPTGGYLLSYPLVAYLVGALAERGWDRTVWRAALAMLIGNIIILLLGATWLNVYKGTLFNVSVVWAGVYPFIPGDLVKIALGALALPGTWALVSRK